MPRTIIRICPNYTFNPPLTSNGVSNHVGKDGLNNDSYGPQSNWEYNTVESAKYFYESTDPFSITIYPSNVRYDGQSFHFDKIYDSVLSQHDFYRIEIRDLLGFLVNGQSSPGGLSAISGNLMYPMKGLSMPVDQNASNNSSSMSGSFRNETKSATSAKSISHKDVSILVFGDFSSGERFTLQGPPEHPGIIYRSLKDLFSYQHASLYIISLSFYCIDQQSEQITDLLAANHKKKKPQIRLRDHPKRGMVVEGISRVPVASLENGVSLINHIYLQHASQLRYSHVVISINVEWKQPPSLESKGVLSSMTFFSMNIPQDNRGNLLPKSKRLDWVKQMDTCLDGIMNRSPTIPFHKSKPTSILRDLLLGNRPGLIIQALSPNIETYKHMMWSMKLCQRMMDVSPQTKPQLASPAQLRTAKELSPEFEDEDDVLSEKALFQSKQSNNVPSGIYNQGSTSTPVHSHFENSLSINHSQYYSPAVELPQSKASASNPQSSLSQSFVASLPSNPPSNHQQSINATNTQEVPLQRNFSKQSVSTTITQNSMQENSVYSTASIPTNTLNIQAQIADLNTYKKEAASLKAEVEILKRLKTTHERKISQLEESLENFRTQHNEAVRSLKKNSKKISPGDRNTLSHKDFDIYREVMEQTITRLKDTQAKYEEQNEALKRALQKRDQELRKREKEIIQLKKSQDELQILIEKLEIDQQNNEKKLKSYEKKIQQFEKVDINKQTELEVPEGFVLIKQDKIAKYESYIKETVELNEVLRAEALKQSHIIDRYQQQYGGLSNGVSNLSEPSENEEQLRKQLHVVKTALADALKQLALSRQ